MFLLKVISEKELGDRNLLIVGDVHGCYDELVELLDVCGVRSATPTTSSSPSSDAVCVMFVGDLTNKGPKSAEVVKLIRAMGSQAYCVRGNHDEISLREWQDYQNGNPLSEEFSWLRELTQEDLHWVSQLPYTIQIPSRRIIITHAGLVPGVALEEQDLDLLIHLRDLKKDEEGGWVGLKKPRAQEGSIPWASAWPGPEHVYFGHDAIRLLQKYDFATGLDTGCVYGRKLTAVFPFEAGRTVQVNCHRVYRDPTKKKTPRNKQ